MFTINEPVTVRGYIQDSAVISPENSVMTSCRDQYSVTIEVEEPTVLDELDMAFDLNAHPAMESSSNWRIGGTHRSITSFSIVPPRLGGIKRGLMAEEIKQGTLVDVRLKPVIRELDSETLNTLLLIGVSLVDRSVEGETMIPPADELEKYCF